MADQAQRQHGDIQYKHWVRWKEIHGNGIISRFTHQCFGWSIDNNGHIRRIVEIRTNPIPSLDIAQICWNLDLDSATTLACPCLTKSPLGLRQNQSNRRLDFRLGKQRWDLASLIKRRCSSDKIISVIIHHCWRQTLLYNMTMSKKSNIKKWLHTFIKSPFAAFIVGALIGLIFFAWFYGLDIVNPTYTDWIWHPITHDTAQHQLGWEFLRQDSDGLMINGLAYPVGLSAVFMDVIPLFALIFKPFVAWLPQ